LKKKTCSIKLELSKVACTVKINSESKRKTTNSIISSKWITYFEEKRV
jgi:hypothetical protein